MPNWRKTLLTVGISSCLLGGALIATGTATGGINHLLQANHTKYSKRRGTSPIFLLWISILEIET